MRDLNLRLRGELFTISNLLVGRQKTQLPGGINNEQIAF